MIPTAILHRTYWKISNQYNKWVRRHTQKRVPTCQIIKLAFYEYFDMFTIKRTPIFQKVNMNDPIWCPSLTLYTPLKRPTNYSYYYEAFDLRPKSSCLWMLHVPPPPPPLANKISCANCNVVGSVSPGTLTRKWVIKTNGDEFEASPYTQTASRWETWGSPHAHSPRASF